MVHGSAETAQIMVVDLTKLGSAWSKHLHDITAVVSQNMASNPEWSMALVVAPNRAQWGKHDSEKSLNDALLAVEKELRGEDAQLQCRRVTLAFKEDTLTGSARAACHG